jgi:hypothetical protein
MLIRRHIAVENFIHCFFTADFDNIIIFCKHVDNTELASLNCQAADAEGAISPPWSLETWRIPWGIWLDRRDMEISAIGSKVPVEVRLWVDPCAWLFIWMITILPL